MYIKIETQYLQLVLKVNSADIRRMFFVIYLFLGCRSRLYPYRAILIIFRYYRCLLSLVLILLRYWRTHTHANYIRLLTVESFNNLSENYEISHILFSSLHFYRYITHSPNDQLPDGLDGSTGSAPASHRSWVRILFGKVGGNLSIRLSGGRGGGGGRDEGKGRKA